MLAGIPSTLAGCSGRRDHAGRAQRQDRSRQQPPPVHALADEQGGDDGRTGPSAGAVGVPARVDFDQAESHRSQ